MASKKKKKPTTTLSLELTPNELTALEVWADKNGVSLEDYAKTVLVSSVPFTEQMKLAQATQRQVTMNQAYEMLEKAEGGAPAQASAPSTAVPRLPTSVPMTQTPARKPVPSSSTGMLREHKVTLTRLPTVPPGPHPCFHLSTKNIPGHLQGQCQGVCQHRDQAGRICHWAPMSASHCDFFDARPRS